MVSEDDAAIGAADWPDIPTFEAMVTLDDQLALQMRCLTALVVRGSWLRQGMIIVLIACILSPLSMAVGTVIGWATTDGQRVSLGTLFRELFIEEPSTTILGVLGIAVYIALARLIRRLLLRPRIRRVLRRIFRARPDVDLKDPQLAYPAQVTINDDGFESRTATGSTLVRWNVLKRWEETDGRFIVLGDPMAGFCLNTSALDPTTLNLIRGLLKARLGPARAGR